jgi:hypothetical protein
VMQFAIPLVAAIQAVLVGFANDGRITHALTPIRSEGQWVLVAPRLASIFPIVAQVSNAHNFHLEAASS